MRGDLVELGAQDLRFTASEGVELFNDGLHLALSTDDVDRLVSRTEGWAAGLQLAGLRMRSSMHPAKFVERFSGADRHVVDYLGEEVLRSQPPRVLEFLVRTSVLNRLCAPVCDALTGERDGAQLLEQVLRANLFLIPLDEERRWFRYHHLFGELLRHELARTAPDQVVDLHLRAALWYSAAGHTAEAIGHAMVAGDTALASRLVAAGWRRQFNAGHLDTVRSWLAALPADLVAAEAPLSVARVWIAIDSGRLDEVGAALDAAEASGHVDTHLRVLRALHIYKTGDVESAAARLRTITPSGADPFVSTVHRLLSGVTALWGGDLARARDLLQDAARRAEEDDNHLGHVYARGYLALIAVLCDDLDTAHALADEAQHLVRETLADEHFVAMIPALARARLLAAAERDGQREATDWAATSVRLGRRGAGRVELAGALLTAAMTARSTGAVGSARSLLADARAVLRTCPGPGPLVTSWLATEQRAPGPHDDGEQAVEPLTERELAILALLPTHMSQRQLASTLFIAPNTIKTHVRAIYRKLGADSRGDAVVRARRRGLI